MAAYSKICIVQLGRIGDLILTTPLIKTIRDAYPSAELHILAGRNNFFTLKGYPFVNSLHVHTKRPLKTVLLLLRLRRERFDLWIDPKDHHSTESRLFVRLARPRESVGFNRKNETLYTHSIKSNIEQFNDHAIDRYLNSVAFLGLKPAMQRPLLYCGKAAEEKIVSFLRINGITRYCHVHISASRPERYWEEAKWCALLKQLEEKNVFCLISAGPLDIELANRDSGDRPKRPLLPHAVPRRPVFNCQPCGRGHFAGHCGHPYRVGVQPPDRGPLRRLRVEPQLVCPAGRSLGIDCQ
jgi:heptosyltransferase-3